MTHILSKSTYIKGLQCEKALYMFKKHPYLRDKLSLEQRAIFKRGTDVGILARELFPGGENMTPASPTLFSKMHEKTLENMKNPNINVMYEAIFIHNETLIMLDILVRDGNKWKAIEVKSSMTISDTYKRDAALQYYVLKGCNIDISDIQLMYINGNYIRDKELDLSQLFICESVKEYAENHLHEIEDKINHFKDIISKDKSPYINIGAHCFSPYKCDFHGHCWKKTPDNSFLHISACDNNSLFNAYNNGITNNEGFKKIIDPLSLEMQQIDALEQNTYYIDYKKFYKLVEKRTESTAFLNILFQKPAVPLLEGHKPYQEIMLAFSILNGEDNKTTNWHCLDDISKMHVGIKILSDELKHYDKVIYFSSQNINHLIYKYNIIDSKDITYRICNFRDVLIQSDFFNKKTKYDFSLKTIYEAIFPNEIIPNHDRISYNAMSNNSIEHLLALEDMEEENKYLKKVFLNLRR